MLLSTRKPVLEIALCILWKQSHSNPCRSTFTLRMLPVSRNGSKQLNLLLVKFCSTCVFTHREHFATPFAHTDFWKGCCPGLVSHKSARRSMVFSKPHQKGKEREMDQKEV